MDYEHLGFLVKGAQNKGNRSSYQCVRARGALGARVPVAVGHAPHHALAESDHLQFRSDVL